MKKYSRFGGRGRTKRIVRKLVADFAGRSGFGSVWESMDHDTKRKIIKNWESIVYVGIVDVEEIAFNRGIIEVVTVWVKMGRKPKPRMKGWRGLLKRLVTWFGGGRKVETPLIRKGTPMYEWLCKVSNGEL